MAQRPVTYNGTITDWQSLTESLAIFRVRQDKPFETFVPGQYTVLGRNFAETSVSRAYSIASAPETVADGLEFYIRRVPVPASEQPLTHLLFECKVGDQVWVGPKPRGHFTIEHCVGEHDDRYQIFVAAGTGLAPFVSMALSHRNRHGKVNERHVMLHGCSYECDLGYRAEMEALLNIEGRTRYIPTISRPDSAWTGARGRVETLFQNDGVTELEQRLGFSKGFIRPENAVVYICGLTGTISNTIAALLDRGYIPEERKLRNALWIPAETKGALFFEQYDSDPVLDIKNEELMAALRRRLADAGVRLQEPEPVA